MDVGRRTSMRSSYYAFVRWCVCGINRNMKDNLSLFRPVGAQKALVENSWFWNWHLKIQPSAVKNCHGFLDEMSLWVSPVPTAAIQSGDTSAFESTLLNEKCIHFPDACMCAQKLVSVCMFICMSLYACTEYTKVSVCMSDVSVSEPAPFTVWFLYSH